MVSVIAGNSKRRHSLSVIIPTHGRPALLSRTLESVAACNLPETYRELVVVENGSREGAERIVKTLPEHLNARYMHEERGNKSNALNSALETINDGLVVFFDDDVWVHPNTVKAYAKAAENCEGGAFFGGSVQVDREAEPAEWLELLLPDSVCGYEVGPHCDRSWYLGFNWAAFSTDIKKVGGFDPYLGPGSPLGTNVGDETELQARMRDAGLDPIDVPGAIVTHRVPRGHCTLSWILKRRISWGVSTGVKNKGIKKLIGKVYSTTRAQSKYTIKGVLYGKPKRLVGVIIWGLKIYGIVIGYINSRVRDKY